MRVYTQQRRSKIQLKPSMDAARESSDENERPQQDVGTRRRTDPSLARLTPPRRVLRKHGILWSARYLNRDHHDPILDKPDTDIRS